MRRWSETNRFAAAATTAAATAVVAIAGLPGRGPASASAAAPGCPKFGGTLTPRAKGPSRYTMLIRINKEKNVADYANWSRTTGSFRRQLRRRDIFVINTRFRNSSPEEWLAIASALRHSFPCNRIISLNGLSPDPTSPGYSLALANHPGLWGLSLDWESGDWNDGRTTKPAIPPWTDAAPLTRVRIWKRLGRLGRVSQRALGGPGLRVGVVPAHYPHWDYGLIARVADRRNARRRRGRRGFQIVQTQGYCPPSGSVAGFRSITGELLRQYRPRFRIVRRRRKGKLRKVRVRVPPRGVQRTLALEVSFSTTPDPNDPRPVASVPPGAAARCTRVGLHRGASAFLYWAHPDSIRALLAKPRICAIRPPCPTPGNGGGVAVP
jgi:hypothetical protein